MTALALLLALLALPLRAADVERAALPELGPTVAAPAPAQALPSLSLSEASLLWNAASLPPVDLASWQKLQQNDAAALHASAILLERLERPGYRAQLRAIAGKADGARLESALITLAKEKTAAGPAAVAGAQALVLREAPRAAAAPAAADLGRLSVQLGALQASGELPSLSVLRELFDRARPIEGSAVVAAPAAAAAAPAPALARSEARSAAAEAPPPVAAAHEKPKHALGLKDLVALGVNSIIGAGIFVKPALLAKQAGASSVFAFPLTALLLIPVGLTFAEAATYFHGKDGGAYQYVKGAFGSGRASAKAGEWASFSVTWMAWIALLFGWAAVSSVIAINLSYFVPALANPWAAKGLAAAAIATISYINFRGVKEGAAVSNAFAVAKVVPMLLFVLLGLTALHPGAYAALAPKSVSTLAGACFMTFFALQGFENIAVPGGEVHEPSKNLPRAVILSLVIASLIYAGIQVVAVGVTPHLATATKPLVDGGYAIAGALGAGVMALCAFFSTTGDSAAAALFGARFIKVLADDDHVPGSRLIRRIHPRFGTPHVAIALTSALTIACVFLPIETLMDVSSIAVSAQYIGTCLALPFLRRRMSAAPGAFRLPGGALIPLAGAASALSLSIAGGFGSLKADFALLALGLLIKAAWSLLRPKSA